MSVQQGFGGGFGCVFGALAAIVILIFAFSMAGKVVSPCPSCHTSGNCSLYGGSGKGMIFGDCMSCAGKKSCPDCGGRG